MAVIVEYTDQSKARGTTERRHDDGKIYLIRDGGHLFVQNKIDAAAQYTVAVYAPGSWNSARTVGEASA